MKPNSIHGANVSRTPSENAMRSRDKERTQKALQYAMLKVKNTGQKMSISAVAREANVHASLIHNTYPDIAEEIRAEMGRSTRTQRDQKADELVKARTTIRELREKNAALESDLAKLASLNLTLENEIAVLNVVVGGGMAVLSPRNAGREPPE